MRASKLFGAGALLVSLSLFAAACGDDSDEDSSCGNDRWRRRHDGRGRQRAVGVTCDGLAIGFFGALTGDAANLGVNIKQGAELAVDCSSTRRTPTARSSSRSSTARAAPTRPRRWPSRPSTTRRSSASSARRSRVSPRSPTRCSTRPVSRSSRRRPRTVDLAEQGWTIFHRALGNDAAQGPGAALYIDSTLRRRVGLRHRRRERVRQGSRRPRRRGARRQGRRHRHDRPGRDRLLGDGDEGQGRAARRHLLRWLLRRGGSALEAAP